MFFSASLYLWQNFNEIHLTRYNAESCVNRLHIACKLPQRGRDSYGDALSFIKRTSLTAP
jgi:hypothetical protein